MNLDLSSIPEDFLDKREVTFLYDVNERFQQSAKILRDNFRDIEKLNVGFEFLTFGLLADAVRGDFNTIDRTWFFPSSEAEMELDNAINHCLIGSYKAAYDHLRRGLELILINIYLTHDKTAPEKAKLWMSSKSNTPYFSREVIKNIINHERFTDANKQLNWSNDIKDFYYKLCDIVHVNGVKRGFQKLNAPSFYLSGTAFVNIKKGTLLEFFGDFITAMEFISLALALYNPILLIDLPMTEKFGLNPPMSGFFEWGQSEILNKLIPEKYKIFCENLKTTDDELLRIKDWIESMPDLTEEEFKEQVREQEKFIGKINKENL